MIGQLAVSDVDTAAALSIRADVSEVRRASEWLEKTCQERGVPEDETGRLDLCLNEALANALTHGQAGGAPQPIRLRLAVSRENEVAEATVTVSDAGIAFDPLAAVPKLRPKTLAEAEPGGLGLFMIQSITDKLSYRYDDGYNHLSFSVCW